MLNVAHLWLYHILFIDSLGEGYLCYFYFGVHMNKATFCTNKHLCTGFCVNLSLFHLKKYLQVGLLNCILCVLTCLKRLDCFLKWKAPRCPNHPWSQMRMATRRWGWKWKPPDAQSVIQSVKSFYSSPIHTSSPLGGSRAC